MVFFVVLMAVTVTWPPAKLVSCPWLVVKGLVFEEFRSE